PDLVDQPIDGDDLVAVEQQDRKGRPLLGTAQPKLSPLRPYLDRPEDPKLHLRGKRKPEIEPREHAFASVPLPFLCSSRPPLRRLFAAPSHAPRNRPQWAVEGERSTGMKRDRSSRKRRQLARAVERAAVPERPFARAPRYLVHPNVTTACAASLHAIAA